MQHIKKKPLKIQEFCDIFHRFKSDLRLFGEVQEQDSWAFLRSQKSFSLFTNIPIDKYPKGVYDMDTENTFGV